MEPADLFDVCIFRWFRTIAKFVGIDLFAEKFKPNVLTYAFITSLLLFMVSCIWTVYSYEFDEKVICSALIAFNCQGIVKFFSVLTNAKSLKDMCDFSLKIYRANAKSSPNKALLAKSVKLTVLIFKIGMVLLIITATLTLLRPCISYVAFGIVDPILPTHFPGIEDEEAYGYALLALLHTYIALNFVAGTAGCDLFLMAMVIHSYTMTQIFRNAVNDLNRMAVQIHNRHTSNPRLRLALKNLILMHNDFIKYTRTLKTMYNEMCLIQITMANTVMIVLIYVILLLDWFPAYFLISVAFFQVFEYSLMGTVVEIANENMYNAICNILVIDFPIAEQKKIILMTLLAQHPHNLTIGGFQSLNVETFVYSMKNTYSVAMLLVSTQNIL